MVFTAQKVPAVLGSGTVYVLVVGFLIHMNVWIDVTVSSGIEIDTRNNCKQMQENNIHCLVLFKTSYIICLTHAHSMYWSCTPMDLTLIPNLVLIPDGVLIWKTEERGPGAWHWYPGSELIFNGGAVRLLPHASTILLNPSAGLKHFILMSKHIF